MLKRILLANFFFCLLLNMGIGYSKNPSPALTKTQTVFSPRIDSSDENADFPKIRSMSISGPVVVQIHLTPGTKKERIVLSGIDHPYSLLKTDVKGDTLYLASNQSKLVINATLSSLRSLSLHGVREATIQSEKSKPFELSLDTHQVDFLYLSGFFDIPSWVIEGDGHILVDGPISLGTLKAYASSVLKLENLKALNNRMMVIRHMGSGDIILKGNVNTAKIYQGGKGKLDFQLMTDDSILIDAYDGGAIRIAGRTRSLIVNLMHQVQLDARDLRSDRIFIKTHDSSFAKINPTSALFAAAYDSSKIGYIQEPENLYVFPNRYGHVFLIRK